MEGVDIHLDVNIGKQLSALGHTLTSLSGFEEDEPTTMDSPDSDDGDQTEKSSKVRMTCDNASVGLSGANGMRAYAKCAEY